MSTQAPSAVRLEQMIFGYVATQLVHVSARSGLVDALAEPLTLHDLAAALGLDRRRLERILRGLGMLGLITESPDGRFALTAEGARLRRDAPSSLWRLALVNGEILYRAWGSMATSLGPGPPAFDRAFGVPYYRYLDVHPEAGALFDRQMAMSAPQIAQRVLGAFAWPPRARVVDVGGGEGGLLGWLLAARPDLTGIVFDHPRVAEAARQHLRALGLEGRCEVRAGSFFEAVPAGGDVYLLSRILSDWDDADAGRLLRSCRGAMTASARLLVLDGLEEQARWTPGEIQSDLTVLALLGGYKRSRADYAGLLEAAAFRLEAATDTEGPLSLLEARPVEDRGGDVSGS